MFRSYTRSSLTKSRTKSSRRWQQKPPRRETCRNSRKEGEGGLCPAELGRDLSGTTAERFLGTMNFGLKRGQKGDQEQTFSPWCFASGFPQAWRSWVMGATLNSSNASGARPLADRPVGSITANRHRRKSGRWRQGAERCVDVDCRRTFGFGETREVRAWLIVGDCRVQSALWLSWSLLYRCYSVCREASRFFRWEHPR